MQTTEAPRLGVLLGAEGLDGPRAGVGRVTVEMARAVRARGAVHRLALVADGAVVADTVTERNGPVPRRAAAGALRGLAGRSPALVALHAWQLRRRLAAAARTLARGLDAVVVYHAPNLIARPFDGPTVVTVHDLSWRTQPEWHPPERVGWIERNLDATLRQANRFVAVSAHTARALATVLGVEQGRIDVVPPGVSPLFRPMTAAEAAPVLGNYALTDRGYVLAVGTIEPRKNLDRLIVAHRRLPAGLRTRLPLVIAGATGWGAAPDWHGAARLPGYVPDTELVALYARAACVAYPSLHEGFGLPVLEAMACGAPVVTSDVTALPETAGGAAVLVDPWDTAAIADGLRRVLEDEALAGTLRARGLARAAGFTWDRTAEGMVASWRRAAGLSAAEQEIHDQIPPGGEHFDTG